MALWITTFVLAAAAAGATYVAIRLFARAGRLHYRWCTLLGCLLVMAPGSLLVWLLFRQAEAEAAATGQANVGIPLVYAGAWLVSLLGSLVGLAAFLAHWHLKSD